MGRRKNGGDTVTPVELARARYDAAMRLGLLSPPGQRERDGVRQAIRELAEAEAEAARGRRVREQLGLFCEQ